MGDDPKWMHGKYAHIRIPKALFWLPEYRDLMPETKIVYGLMMDRTSLSFVNKARFTNEKGEVTILFPQTEIMNRVSCGHDKATLILQELEKAGLISKRRVGCGRPYEIVVTPMDWALRGLRSDPADNQMPGSGKTSNTEGGESAANNPEPSNPYVNPDTNPDGWAERLAVSYLHRDDMVQCYPEELVDRMARAMANLFRMTAATVRIGKMDVDTTHLRGVVQSLNQDQLASALQVLQTGSVAELTDMEVLNVLYGVYWEPQY